MFNTPVSIPASPLLASCIAHPSLPLSSPSPMHLAGGRRRGVTPDRSTSSANPLRSHCISLSIHIRTLPLLCATVSLTLVHPHPDPYLLCPLVSKYAHFLICIPSIHFLGEWVWAMVTVPDPHSPHTCTGTHSDQILINVKETFQKHCWRIDLKAGRRNL